MNDRRLIEIFKLYINSIKWGMVDNFNKRHLDEIKEIIKESDEKLKTRAEVNYNDH